jgi:hypothetical protein
MGSGAAPPLQQQRQQQHGDAHATAAVYWKELSASWPGVGTVLVLLKFEFGCSGLSFAHGGTSIGTLTIECPLNGRQAGISAGWLGIWLGGFCSGWAMSVGWATSVGQVNLKGYVLVAWCLAGGVFQPEVVMDALLWAEFGSLKVWIMLCGLYVSRHRLLWLCSQTFAIALAVFWCQFTSFVSANCH